ncbi:MAG TPA: two-component sensor histidine kinase, partial [Umezawaea sp.]|nr:two-component sensor histidine kinase [Umezawaea sp.]
MRRSLALVALAVTSMIALAFLIPLALVVAQLAEDRALAEAERQAVALTPVLVITNEPRAIEQALASTQYGGAGRIAVHLPSGQVLGFVKSTPEQLATAKEEGKSFTASVSDGRVYLQPVVLDRGRVAV